MRCSVVLPHMRGSTSSALTVNEPTTDSPTLAGVCSERLSAAGLRIWLSRTCGNLTCMVSYAISRRIILQHIREYTSRNPIMVSDTKRSSAHAGMHSISSRASSGRRWFSRMGGDMPDRQSGKRKDEIKNPQTREWTSLEQNPRRNTNALPLPRESSGL